MGIRVERKKIRGIRFGSVNEIKRVGPRGPQNYKKIKKKIIRRREDNEDEKTGRQDERKGFLAAGLKILKWIFL